MYSLKYTNIYEELQRQIRGYYFISKLIKTIMYINPVIKIGPDFL